MQVRDVAKATPLVEGSLRIPAEFPDVEKFSGREQSTGAVVFRKYPPGYKRQVSRALRSEFAFSCRHPSPIQLVRCSVQVVTRCRRDFDPEYRSQCG